MKKIMTLIIVGVWCLQSAAETLWHMPTAYGDRNFHTANIIEFAREVEAATEGAFVIKVHSAGSLFKHPEIATVVRRGLVPIGELLISRLANENPLYDVDSVPFLASSYDQAQVLWKVSRPALEKVLEERGMMLLFAVPWPPQGIYAGKELRTTADVRGLRVRAYNRATEQLAQAAGGIPTQVEASDIPTAFSTGRVDAMITSPSTGANTQAWDYVSHFHNVNAFLVKNMVVVNKKAFNELPADHQRILKAAARDAEKRGWDASRRETQHTIQTMADNGMSIVPARQPLMEELQGIGEQMTVEWLERAGPAGEALIKQYREALTKQPQSEGEKEQ